MKWRTDNYAMLSFENLFTFLSYPHVPYDNNASERGAIPEDSFQIFIVFHLFRYYILICILMIIFLGRMLKECKDSEREPKEV